MILAVIAYLHKRVRVRFCDCRIGCLEAAMKARCRRFVLSLAVAALFAAVAQSQESRATLSGTVTDPSGSVIPATVVSLTNSQTGVAFKTKTNEAGQYRFLFLNPGAYRLSVQSPGFRTFVCENIQL